MPMMAIPIFSLPPLSILFKNMGLQGVKGVTELKTKGKLMTPLDIRLGE